MNNACIERYFQLIHPGTSHGFIFRLFVYLFTHLFPTLEKVTTVFSGLKMNIY